MTRRISALARPARVAVALAAALFLLAGCFNPFDPREAGPGISSPPPAADSPGNVLRLLEWAYDNRAIAEYRELFTDDYRFVFSVLDPYGNAYRDVPWTREDELISATHLFQGGHATEPAASSIILDLDRNFRVSSDPRPGKGDRMHKNIRTSVILTIVDPNKETRVTGFASFFLVRGDVALIPEELRLRGFGPDSSRWYVERWEDDTANITPGGNPAVARPAAAGMSSPSLTLFRVSWGGLKVILR